MPHLMANKRATGATRPRSLLYRWGLPAAVLILFAAGFMPAAGAPLKGYLHAALVSVQREWISARSAASGQAVLTVDEAIVYHDAGAEEEARLVGEMAAEFAPRAARLVGTTARADMTIILAASRRDMVDALGARYGSNTIGAYWRGVVWVLSPRAWLSGPDWAGRFRREGPVAHEITHHLLDAATAGNLPAWWDEGVAQYVEFRLTGYQWVEEANRLDQRLYGLGDLTTAFHDLDNEPLAYREAFLFIRYLVDAHGEGVIASVNGRLARGEAASRILESITGYDLATLESSWHRWLAEHGEDSLAVRRNMGSNVDPFNRVG